MNLDKSYLLYLGVIGALVVLGVGIISVLNSFGQSPQNDHQAILQLQTDIQKQNQTINQLTKFLVNSQIPFDQKIILSNNTIQERLNILEHKR